MSTGTWPDLLAYKTAYRVPDDVDNAAIADALDAVLAAIEVRCPVLFGATPVPVPADAYQAALMWTNRLIARRNSPEFLAGVTEMGVASVPRWDADVARLLSPYVDPVLG